MLYISQKYEIKFPKGDFHVEEEETEEWIEEEDLEEEIINDSLVVELDSSSTQLKENELKVTDSVKSKINKLPKNSTK